MNNKKVLFLGCAYSQIPVIKEAREQGWYIITCDYLTDNPYHRLADEIYSIRQPTDSSGSKGITK